MDAIIHYFRLLQIEVSQMATQMDVELATTLAALVIAAGWFFLRGNAIQR